VNQFTNPAMTYLFGTKEEKTALEEGAKIAQRWNRIELMVLAVVAGENTVEGDSCRVNVEWIVSRAVCLVEELDRRREAEIAQRAKELADSQEPE